MSEPFTAGLVRGSLRCANYWQAVLRFGLPCVLLYRLIDYALFRATLGSHGLRYPWRPLDAVADLLFVFLLSTPWWWLTREIAAWRARAGGASRPAEVAGDTGDPRPRG
jgi:hypothetical protein